MNKQQTIRKDQPNMGQPSKGQPTMGKIIFFPDSTDDEPPRQPYFQTWALHYQRSNGAEIGGWWALNVSIDGLYSDVLGPFRTERKAIAVAQEWARRDNGRFIP